MKEIDEKYKTSYWFELNLYGIEIAIVTRYLRV